jgi:predicted CXXCH cytochrome family protein
MLRGMVTAYPALAVILLIGCNATSRYEILSLFFDGVPPPAPAEVAEEKAARVSAGAGEAPRFTPRGHGPYAAKMCTACHESAATNTLVAPRDQLCFHCHDLKLDKKYVHGPLASGGCLACHDPHGSRYRYLLVSEADTFCVFCHDQQAIARIEAHAGTSAQCTACHDAHMSDKPHLLK